MGTNYYIRTPGCKEACPHCAESELIHLGKSSMGWKFGFRSPTGAPRDEAYVRWHALIDVYLLNGAHIEDEYGTVVTKQELLDLIESKQDQRSHLNPFPEERQAWAARRNAILYDSLMQAHFDCDGYDFCDREFS